MRNAPLTADDADALRTAELSLSSAVPCHNGAECVIPEWALRALANTVRAMSPPPDAAVREAVEYLSSGWGEGSEASRFKAHVDTLIRAVQAPRLTGEQAACARGIYGQLHGAGRMAAATWLRAEFPEVFAGEVGNG